MQHYLSDLTELNINLFFRLKQTKIDISKLSPQSHTLFYKVFFWQETVSSPCKYLWLGLSVLPSTHFFQIPIFSKFSTEDCPPGRNVRAASKDVFLILRNESGQKMHGNFINGFSEKVVFQANGSFWAKKWHNLVFVVLL